MKWEDQEINFATPAGSIREVIKASFRIRSLAEQAKGAYLRITQDVLDREFKEEKRALIHRLCLYERASCGVGPGGGTYPDLGVSHYWCDSQSAYAIMQIDPWNGWLEIMVLHAVHPNDQNENGA